MVFQDILRAFGLSTDPAGPAGPTKLTPFVPDPAAAAGMTRPTPEQGGQGAMAGALDQGNPIARQLSMLTPEQRWQVLGSSFGGAAQAMAPLMGPQRRPVGLAQILTAMAGGMSQGQQAGMNQLRQDRRGELEERVLGHQEQRLAAATEQEAREAQEAAEQQAAREAWFQTLTPDQQTLARAYSDEFGKGHIEQQFAKPEGPSSGLGKLRADLDAGLITPQEYQAKLRKETHVAPTQGPETWRTLSPEEAAKHGIQGPAQISSNDQIRMISGAQPTPDQRTRQIADLQEVFGIDRATATGIVDGLVTAVPTEDGRYLLRNKVTNEVQDVTPPVSGYQPLPEGEAAPRVGQDLESTVGAVPRASEVVSKVLGQFVPGAVDEDIAQSRQALRLLERQARSAFANSSRPSQWEQQLIKELFPSEGVLESPARAAVMLKGLRDEATKTYNDYTEALKDPSVTGGTRAELTGKRIELQRLINAIDIPEDEYQRLLGRSPAPAATEQPSAGEPVYEMQGGKLVRVQ